RPIEVEGSATTVRAAEVGDVRELRGPAALPVGADLVGDATDEGRTVVGDGLGDAAEVLRTASAIGEVVLDVLRASFEDRVDGGDRPAGHPAEVVLEPMEVADVDIHSHPYALTRSTNTRVAVCSDLSNGAATRSTLPTRFGLCALAVQVMRSPTCGLNAPTGKCAAYRWVMRRCPPAMSATSCAS